MKKSATVAGVAVLVLAAGWATWTALARLRDARGFGVAHAVQTAGGTNYVVRLRETTIGRTEAGLLVVVALRLENPNPFALTLDRRGFVLMDGDKDFYLPNTTESQPASIAIPARGMTDNELLTYAVQDDTLHGALGLQLGHDYWTLLKNAPPYTQPLNKDEYRTFRRRDW